ncbi:MAG TPA: F0F1 ATP synthase subunit delta [Steroidobacteraceae bacterium]|nr:F0F1 ATP synthase subunit delta [Steroidobacteraceae bacterium]
MAEKATIARPYARAAFEHAHESQSLAAWSQLLAAGAAVAATPGADALFGNPRVSAAELIELVAGVATESGAAVGADGRNFLGVLAHEHRLALLPEIAAQFEARRAEVENQLDVEITSAVALTDAQRAAFRAALGKRFGRNVRLAEQVDPTLVGGAVVRAGDMVIDGSLRGRLARLEQQISQP